MTSTFMSGRGFFNEHGHPVSIASGDIRVATTAEKIPRYFVLTPLYLALFADEAAAAIDLDGYVHGSTLQPADSLGVVPGLQIELTDVTTVHVLDDNPKCVLVVLSADSVAQRCIGHNNLCLECVNIEYAFGWAEAIQQQVSRANLAASRNQATTPKSKTSPSASPDKTPTSTKKFGVFTSMLSSPALIDTTNVNSYTATTPWESKGLDLMLRINGSLLNDAEGYPAAVRFGWLTKRNKSGMRTHIEKERVFVLTPYFLAYFPDMSTANIVGDYMRGGVKGERISGFFVKVGARLPLESVCGVTYGFKDGTEPVPPKGPKPYVRATSPINSASEMAALTAASAPAPADEPSMDSSRKEEMDRVRTTCFEVDFGEYVLQLNAHSTRNCYEWVTAIQKWSTWQKAQVDTKMLHSFNCVDM